jgi:hypothetical protein
VQITLWNLVKSVKNAIKFILKVTTSIIPKLGNNTAHTPTQREKERERDRARERERETERERESFIPKCS